MIILPRLFHAQWIALIVNHLWQSTIFVLAAWLLTLALKKNQARIRYWIWMLASMKFLLPFSLLIKAGERLHTHAHSSLAAMPTLPETIYGFAEPFSRSVSAQPATPMTVSVATQSVAQTHSDVLPMVLLTIWACGALFLLARWGVRWFRIRRMVWRSSPIAVECTVPVLSGPSHLEPGIFGIFWPVLLLPEGIAKRLSPAQLDAIVAHEICHVRRRDNLTAALHMLVEVVFWFYPLVWWIGAGLMEERERACDEAVLESCSEALTYAEGILNVCKTYMEAPMNCVSGVMGSNLKKRISRILSGSVAGKLNLRRKLLLALAAVLAVAAPVATGVFHTTQAQAEASAANPSFKDVTIVASNPNEPGKGFRIQGTRFNAVNWTVLELLTFTFGIHAKQLENAPAWLESEKYNIEAKLDTPAPPEAQLKKILEKLLVDRMKLKFHKKQRKVKAYILEVAKDGPKLEKSNEGPNSRPSLLFSGPGVLNVHNANMTNFSQLMQEAVLDRPVVDKTGLQDRWNFTLNWTLDEAQSAKFADMIERVPPASDAADAPPPLFTAIQQQIGLKFSSKKTKLPVVVIDHIEKPAVDLDGLGISDNTAAFDQTNSAPHPGTEAALRRHIEGIMKKQPVTEEMAPGLVAAVEEQWPQLEGAFESFGALKSVAFAGNENGNDVYHVEFENAALTWTIGPLIDGKVSTLFFSQTAKRDGNGPSPGLADAIRRMLEGDFTGEPPYEIMSPALQAAVRQQLPRNSATAKRLGAVKAITFQNINTRGWDVYHVTFANGSSTVQAEPLTVGKLNGILQSDITIKGDGNEPSPGLAGAIRREPEGNFAEGAAYRNVSIQLASGGPGEMGSIMFNPGTGGLEIRGQTLRFVIAEAYGVNEVQVVGRDWDNEPHYNITADGLKASGSTRGSEFAPPSEMYGASLRELLANEFGLVTSSEKGQLDGYALLIGNGEPKLTVGAAGMGQHTFEITHEGLKITSLPLSEVTKFLSSLFGGLVIDQTGLQGNFDFEVKLPTSMSPDNPPDPAALSKAFEQQLGLKIEAKKLNVDVIKVVNLKPSAEVVTSPLSVNEVTTGPMPAPPPESEELRAIPHHFTMQLRADPTEKVDRPPAMPTSTPPPPPQYPLTAARNKIEGRVVTRFVVDTDGKTKNPEILEADPEGVFEESMLANIEQLEFIPATLDGEQVPCMMNYTIEFKLN